MADIAVSTEAYHGHGAPKLNQKPSPIGAVIFFCILAADVGYGIHGLLDDIASVHEPLALGVFALLGLALLIALGFEFLNGFHDTANAVATVIYTYSMQPMAANGSAPQWSTVRSIALAWVITLPAAMALAGLLYFLLRRFI